MALDLFAGIPVGDYEAAKRWYERLLRKAIYRDANGNELGERLDFCFSSNVAWTSEGCCEASVRSRLVVPRAAPDACLSTEAGSVEVSCDGCNGALREATVQAVSFGR